MAVITVSRRLGSKAREICERVAELIEYEVVDKQIISEVAQNTDATEEEVAELDEVEMTGIRGFLLRWLTMETVDGVPVHAWLDFPHHGPSGVYVPIPPEDETEAVFYLDRREYRRLVQETIRKLWRRDRVIIVGRGGMMMLRDAPNVLRVRITASDEFRAQDLMADEGVDEKTALQMLKDSDRRRAAFIKRSYQVDWADPRLYHVVVNAAATTVETAARMIVAGVKSIESET